MTSGAGWIVGLAHQLRHERAHARPMLGRYGRRLHGEVGTLGEALTMAGAAGTVPDVLGVTSRLHIGLLRGQHRPSWDRLAQRPVSPALRYLLAVAARAGLGADHATTAVHAVLSSFAGCLPVAERRRLLGCLPADVGRLAGEARHASPWIDHPAELISRVAAVSGLDDLVRAERVTVAVLGALREILPPTMVASIGRALPCGLRPLWQVAGQRVREAGWPLRRWVWKQVGRGEWQWRWVDAAGQPPGVRQAAVNGAGEAG